MPWAHISDFEIPPTISDQLNSFSKCIWYTSNLNSNICTLPIGEFLYAFSPIFHSLILSEVYNMISPKGASSFNSAIYTLNNNCFCAIFFCNCNRIQSKTASTLDNYSIIITEINFI